jgi:hypothetical protein
MDKYFVVAPDTEYIMKHNLSRIMIKHTVNWGETLEKMTQSTYWGLRAALVLTRMYGSLEYYRNNVAMRRSKSRTKIYIKKLKNKKKKTNAVIKRKNNNYLVLKNNNHKYKTLN